MHFRRDDIVDGDIRNTKILHIEGYMLEHPDIKAACVEAMELAKAGGAMVSIDLADPSLIERNSEDFKALMKTHADILFVNEEEAFAFTGAKGEEALDRLSEYGDIAIVKLGKQGSIIKSGGSVYRIPAFVTDVVNTNGAGDMYAAGMLYGISHGFSMKRSGMIGSYMASLGGSGGRAPRRNDRRVISGYKASPRPQAFRIGDVIDEQNHPRRGIVETRNFRDALAAPHGMVFHRSKFHRIAVILPAASAGMAADGTRSR